MIYECGDKAKFAAQGITVLPDLKKEEIFVWSMWDAPSDRDYYSQFRPEWDPEEEPDEPDEVADQPDAPDNSLESLNSEEEECPF